MLSGVYSIYQKYSSLILGYKRDLIFLFYFIAAF